MQMVGAAAAMALSLVGCAMGSSAQGTAAAPNPETPFHAEGEVASQQGTAAWSSTRVVGPKIDMSRRADGTWAGRIGDLVVDVSVQPGRVVGSDLTAAYSRTGDKTVITGLLHGQMIRYEFDAQHVNVSSLNRSLSLTRDLGTGGDVRISSAADAADAPEPQLTFAMIGAFM